MQQCRILATLAMAASLTACHKTDATPPVATVTVTPAKPRVSSGAPIDLTYKFEVASRTAIAADYRVFVHVLAPDGQTLWNDDHEPAVPTSQWKPGQTVQYTRTTFVPVDVRAASASVEVGLYRDSDRLPLQGSDTSGREANTRAYRVATVQLGPQSDNVFLIYKSGWYAQEFSTSDPASTWAWTQKSAVLAFKNPRADATLLLDVAARPDLFPGQPQQVTVSAGGQTLGTFRADSLDPTLHRVAIPAAALGAGDMAELHIDVDRTFRPASGAAGKDDRELGVQVYHLFIDGR
ncbi:MAG: hypothetical protein ABI634_14240 [Acidobacteriota bacterium]